MQDVYAAAWRTVDTTAQVSLTLSIKEALDLVKLETEKMVCGLW